MIPPLSLDWILDVTVRSFAIMGAGIGLYSLQKRSEKNRNRRDMAKILRNEVRRMLVIEPNEWGELIETRRSGVFPDSRVYNGLLQTGNIRFFSDVLQDELHRWYSLIENPGLDGIDVEDGTRLVQNLEEMERKNTGLMDRLGVRGNRPPQFRQ